MLSANFFISSARFAPFQEATPDVILPNLDEPFLQQSGFGVEYVQEIVPNVDLAAALNYQNFDFSDSLFGGTSFARDFTGTPLAFGDRAQGDLYTLDLNGVYSTFNDRDLPTQGTKIRLGVEQGVNMGNTSTAYTRFATNLTQIFRVPGFNDGNHSLALNLQAGSILGTSPQVRGFHLGGPFSVRGYQPGEMASGTSFVQASLEYRHHLTSFTVRETEIELRGEAFVDYGSVLGTEKNLPGIPEYLWDKPTSGTGYGVGLQFATDFGLFRIETAWNNSGGNTTYLSVGERF